jgi:hypothetical protein
MADDPEAGTPGEIPVRKRTPEEIRARLTAPDSPLPPELAEILAGVMTGDEAG